MAGSLTSTLVFEAATTSSLFLPPPANHLYSSQWLILPAALGVDAIRRPKNVITKRGATIYKMQNVPQAFDRHTGQPPESRHPVRLLGCALAHPGYALARRRSGRALCDNQTPDTGSRRRLKRQQGFTNRAPSF